MAIDIKPRPNHERYIDILRRMEPEARLRKAWELTETSRALLRAGLRRQFPDLPDSELDARYLERLAECHNRNY